MQRINYSSASAFSTEKGSATSSTPASLMTTSFLGLSLESVSEASILRMTFCEQIIKSVHDICFHQIPKINIHIKQTYDLVVSIIILYHDYKIKSTRHKIRHLQCCSDKATALVLSLDTGQSNVSIEEEKARNVIVLSAQLQTQDLFCQKVYNIYWN